MKPILIATKNPAKIALFREILAEYEGELRFLSDFPHLEAPEETAKTVEGNALLKAQYYTSMTGLPSLADDAGLEIEELNDEPGVMARRWGGQLPADISDADWSAFFQKKIDEVPEEGYLHGNIPFARCLYLPSGKHIIQKDSYSFYIDRTPRETNKPGFPLGSFRVALDGRHEADIPPEDPIWKDRIKAKGLLRMLRENL